MTVKEIAAAVGKSEDSVQRWIKKIVEQPQNADIQKVLSEKILLRNGVLNRKMRLSNSIAEKAEHSSPERPANYDLEEALAIIGE